MQACRSTAKMQLFRDCDEVSKMSQLDISIHI